MGSIFDVDVIKRHNFPLPTAKQKAEAVAKQLKTQFPGLEYGWKGDIIVFAIKSGKGDGVIGHLAVTSSQIQIHIHLNVAALPAKPFIEGKINEYCKTVGIP